MKEILSELGEFIRNEEENISWTDRDGRIKLSGMKAVYGEVVRILKGIEDGENIEENDFIVNCGIGVDAV